jgi:hypothetical protein
MTEQTFSYIARLAAPDNKGRPAQTIVACASGGEDFKKEAAKYIAEWIRKGLIVEHVPNKWIRQNFNTANAYQP